MATFPDLVPCRTNKQVLYKMCKQGASTSPYTFNHPNLLNASDENVIWVPNDPFPAELKFIELYATGGSENPQGITAVLKDLARNHVYNLRYDDFVDLLSHGAFRPGGLVARNWRFEKRGPYIVITHR